MVSWVSECKRTRMRGYIYSVWHLFNVENMLSFLCFSLWVCFHCWDRILMFTGITRPKARNGDEIKTSTSHPRKKARKMRKTRNANTSLWLNCTPSIAVAFCLQKFHPVFLLRKRKKSTNETRQFSTLFYLQKFICSFTIVVRIVKYLNTLPKAKRWESVKKTVHTWGLTLKVFIAMLALFLFTL